MLATARRFVAVAIRFLPLLFAYARDRRRFLLFGGARRPDEATRAARADRLLGILIDLGPTFIKLGQLLSTRPDVLPPVYVERLSQLQDDVPPAPFPAARDIIEEELGPIDETFTGFESTAIKGASLGQVYRAELDGRPVAVKVRRPGVADRVERDLRVIRRALPLLLWFIDDARAFSLENLADEFARVIREEMDYDREATMLGEIRDNLADAPDVRIPRTFPDHSTDRVLTMEYLEGTKITDVETLDARGVDRTAVAERLERTYLRMVIEDGVFHADPHPGNIAVQDDGTIVFYDFGMSGRVDPDDRDHIVGFYVAVAERDIDAILDTLIDLGTLREDADRQLMGRVLELAIADARGERIEDWRVQQIIDRVESTMYEFPLRLPSRLALVLRVATVVEGVCVTLDPEFDFIDVATEFLTERGYREESIRRAAADVRRQLGAAGFAAMRSAPKAERVLDRIEREELFVRAGLEDSDGVVDRLARRLVLGLFGATALLASGVIYAVRGLDPVAGVALVLAIASGVLIVRSFRGSRGIGAGPRFTRHNLRDRRFR